MFTNAEDFESADLLTPLLEAEISEVVSFSVDCLKIGDVRTAKRGGS